MVVRFRSGISAKAPIDLEKVAQVHAVSLPSFAAML